MNKLHPYIMPGVVADDKQYWWYLKDKVSTERVMQIVAEEYKISVDHLIYSMRRTGPVEARGLCYFILICKLGMTQADITRKFIKERGTVFHAVERIKFLLKTNKFVYDRFISLRNKIEKEVNIL